MLPITFKEDRREYLNGIPNPYGYVPIWWTLRSVSYRQAKPFNLPLAYYQEINSITRFEPHSSNPADWVSIENCPYIDWNSGYGAACYNKAYARFKSSLGDSAAVAVNFAEGRQSMAMVTERCSQLYRFSRALKRLDFASAFSILGLTAVEVERRPRVSRFKVDMWSRKWTKHHYSPRGTKPGYKASSENASIERFRTVTLRRSSKSFADNWLELHFGWAPAVSDIYTATKILSDPWDQKGLKKTASASNTAEVTFGAWPGPTSYKGVVKQTVYISAEVIGVNPNLELASRLGLVNLASVAYELVPWSFVLNWFASVEEYLASFTDFAGLTFANMYHTRTVHWNGDWIGGSQQRAHMTVWKFSRVPGEIPGPSLIWRAPWRLSPSRALTAASLLVQSLK